MKRGLASLAVVAWLVLLAPPANAGDSEAQPVTARSTVPFSTGVEGLAGGFRHLPLLTDGERMIPVNAYLGEPTSVPADAAWRVATPAEVGLSNPDAAQLRRFVGRSRELGEPLGTAGGADPTLEAAAVQAAVWLILETAQPEELPPGPVAERARALVELSKTPAPQGDPPRREASAYALIARQVPLGTDVRLTAILVDAGGAGVNNELITVDARDEPTVARVTKEGAADVVVNLPSTPLTYTARWSTRLPAGTFLVTGGGAARVLAVTADGLPVARASAPLTVEPFSERPLEVAKSALNLAILRDKYSPVADVAVLVAAVLAVVVMLFGLSSLISMFRSGDATVPRRAGGVLLLAVVGWLGYNYVQARESSPAVRAPELGQAFAALDPPLPVEAAWSSTERSPQGDRCYAASSAIDGRIDTAWVSAPGQGTQQALAVQLDGTHWVTTLRMAVGVQRSDTSFATNGRPTRLEVLGDAGWFVPIGDVSQVRRFQTIELPRALLTSRLVVRVIEVTEGWNSSGISELEVIGVAADPRDLEQLSRHAGSVSEPPLFAPILEKKPLC